MIQKLYYCENCFKEGLTQDETIADSIGGIFCSKKCKEDFNKDFRTTTEHKEVENILFKLPSLQGKKEV